MANVQVCTQLSWTSTVSVDSWLYTGMEDRSGKQMTLLFDGECILINRMTNPCVDNLGRFGDSKVYLFAHAWIKQWLIGNHCKLNSGKRFDSISFIATIRFTDDWMQNLLNLTTQGQVNYILAIESKHNTGIRHYFIFNMFPNYPESI